MCYFSKQRDHNIDLFSCILLQRDMVWVASLMLTERFFSEFCSGLTYKSHSVTVAGRLTQEFGQIVHFP